MNNIGQTIFILALVLIPVFLLLFIRDKVQHKKNKKIVEDVERAITQNDDINVYYKISGLWYLGVLILIFGAYALLNKGELLYGFASAFFSIVVLLAILHLLKFRKNNPYISFSASGLVHPYVGMISWGDMQEIKLKVINRRYGMYHMNIAMSNIEPYLNKIPTAQRLFMSANPSSLGVNIGSLSINPELLYKIANAYSAKYKNA